MTKGQRIKTLRERRNMSQEELALKMGTTKQTIYKYEKDIVTNIPSDKIESLCISLMATPGEIFGWNEASAEEEKNSKAQGTIAIRLLKDENFSRVVSLLNELNDEQLKDVETLLLITFKDCFNKNKE